LPQAEGSLRELRGASVDSGAISAESDTLLTFILKDM
jgi:hypothetical protein